MKSQSRTHILCWNMQKLFDWSEHSFRGTGLTYYVGTCKNYLTNQNIPFEKSEALDSHPMLEHAKMMQLIRTFLLRDQRHLTHTLCWNMQRLFDRSEHSFEKLEALDSHSMLEAKIIWLISRTFLLRNQRHKTHILCWNMQKLFDWSEHSFRGTGLTYYVGACKDYLTDQNIPFEKSEVLDSHTMLKHAKIIWQIRSFLLRNQRLDSQAMLEQGLFDRSEHSFWEIRGTGLTGYVGTWEIRTFLLRNQRHWTHMLCWNMQGLFD